MTNLSLESCCKNLAPRFAFWSEGCDTRLFIGIQSIGDQINCDPKRKISKAAFPQTSRSETRVSRVGIWGRSAVHSVNMHRK